MDFEQSIERLFLAILNSPWTYLILLVAVLFTPHWFRKSQRAVK